MQTQVIKRKDGVERKRVMAEINAELWGEFVTEATIRGRTIRWALTEAMRGWIERERGVNPTFSRKQRAGETQP